MVKIFFMVLFSVSDMTLAAADVTVVPPQLDAIIRKIEARQKQDGTLPSAPVKIVEKDGQIIFLKPSAVKKTDAVYFDGGPGIVKHLAVKSLHDGYAFQVALQDNGRSYHHAVRSVNGVDALFFFNDEDIFVYTQTGAGEDVQLQEWIYALKPNAAHGSRWTWVFKSEPWQWPLTVEMDEHGDAAVNRHLPFSVIPITGQARSQYMLNTMLKFKRGEPVKKYFPYAEPVVAMPAMHYSTKEGNVRAVDAGVVNASVDDDSKPRPKVGLDFDRWDEHWHSEYTVEVSAGADEYPLFIQ
jgi:hypothetical protein